MCLCVLNLVCIYGFDVCVKGRPKKPSMFGCTVVVVVAVVVVVVQSPLMSSSKRLERQKLCFLN